MKKTAWSSHNQWCVTNIVTSPTEVSTSDLELMPDPTITAKALVSENNQLLPLAVPVEILEGLGQAKTIVETLGEKRPLENSKAATLKYRCRSLPKTKVLWGKILLDGLAKEQKEAFRGKMRIPANFLLARHLS